jgi:hypothetical protein
MRLAGLALLALLLARFDAAAVYNTIRGVDFAWIAAAVALVVPLIFIKTVRWRVILRANAAAMDLWPALLAYFGSLFIGFLTPGRLGEFVKALHVSRDCGVSSAQAFATVLADRLFDLCALVVVGGAALLAFGVDTLPALLAAVALLVVPMALFLHARTFAGIQAAGRRMGRFGARFFAEDGWLAEMRRGFLALTGPALLVSVALTALAYGVFFGQCYLLAVALELPVDFGTASYAVALGSLVTLIPVSISGLGTREAAMIAYLEVFAIAAEDALSFSLLVFATFYLGGGLIGAAAWWLKPVELQQ